MLVILYLELNLIKRQLAGTLDGSQKGRALLAPMLLQFTRHPLVTVLKADLMDCSAVQIVYEYAKRIWLSHII
jgi:hypothetical protein